MLLDEVAAGFDFVPHEDAEHVVGSAGVLHLHADKRAVGWVERRLAELFGVHLAEAFEARDVQPFLTHLANRGRQAAEIFERDLRLAATENIAGLVTAGSLLR